MKKSLTQLLIFLCYSITWSQHISGYVKDQQVGTILENASVYLKNKVEIGTFTDQEGFFTLRLPKNISISDTLICSRTGYHTKSLPIKNLIGKTNYILLSTKIESLNEVIVEHKKNLFKRLPFKKIGELPHSISYFASTKHQNIIYIQGGNATIKSKTAKDHLNEAFIQQTNFFQNIRADLSWENYKKELLRFNLDNFVIDTINTSLLRRVHHQIHYLDNKLYLLGGLRLSTSRKKQYLNHEIDIIDLNNYQLLRDQTNAHKAINFASVNVDDGILFFGGSYKKTISGSLLYRDKIHLFHPKSGKWYEIGTMPNPKETQGILVNNKVYLIGGFNKRPLNIIESFDIKTKKWQTETILPKASKRPALTKHQSNIYIYDTNRLMLFNTEDKTLVSYSIDLQLRGCSLHYYNNSLYLIGGSRLKGYRYINSKNIYQINIEDLAQTISK